MARHITNKTAATAIERGRHGTVFGSTVGRGRTDVVSSIIVQLALEQLYIQVYIYTYLPSRHAPKVLPIQHQCSTAQYGPLDEPATKMEPTDRIMIADRTADCNNSFGTMKNCFASFGTTAVPSVRTYGFERNGFSHGTPKHINQSIDCFVCRTPALQCRCRLQPQVSALRRGLSNSAPGVGVVRHGNGSGALPGSIFYHEEGGFISSRFSALVPQP